jgi:putative phosphoribosyl transferase
LLSAHRGPSTIVLALPRGGVPVGYQVAQALGAAFDIWVVRKIGLPWHEELGIGAVAEGGCIHLAPGAARAFDLSREMLNQLAQEKWSEVQRRVRRLRGDRPRPSLAGKDVIIVDDGIATGGTVRAVIGDVRAERPRSLVLAVPVAAADTIEALAQEVDEAVCLAMPEDLRAIGFWYDDFRQVSDEEVMALLDRTRERTGRRP